MRRLRVSLLSAVLFSWGCSATVAIDPGPAPAPPTVALFTTTPAVGSAPLVVALDASASTGEAPLSFDWVVDGASLSGELAEHTFADPGCLDVELTVTGGGGQTATATATVLVTNGAIEDEEPSALLFDAPLDGAIVPRDPATNIATFEVRGSLASPGYTSVGLELYRNGELVESFEDSSCPTVDGLPFTFTVEIEAELVTYDLQLVAIAEGVRAPAGEIVDIVAGDILLIQGQSNAVARAYSGDANVNQGPFLRSFGARDEDPDAASAARSWGQAEGNQSEGVDAVGQWALRMGRLLIIEHAIPIGIINGARGGRAIGYFQRNDADATDLATNYGRLLARTQWAGVTDQARAMLFYQGESDGADAEGHAAGFTELLADWKEDFGGVERYYATQVRAGCGTPTLELRDHQRLLPDTLDDLAIMSTTGLNGHDGCHFGYQEGYRLLAERFGRVLSRDLMGSPATPNMDPPNVLAVTISGTQELRLETRDPTDELVVDGDPARFFDIDGTGATVASITSDGNALILSLSGDVAAATSLSYHGHAGADDWVLNTNGVGMLTFADVPVTLP